MIHSNYIGARKQKPLLYVTMSGTRRCGCGAYLFVFLVTTLNNSSSYFLLLSERTPLLESRGG